MGHGPPTTFEAIDRGVKVGLGIDCTSIVAAEMFTAMRISLAWERGNHQLRLAPLKAPKYPRYNGATAFRLATLGGVEAAHVESKTGSIEVGKQADSLLFDALSINLANVSDPFNGIVYHATAADIGTVIIGGEILKENGELLRSRWSTVAVQPQRAQGPRLGQEL